MRRLELTPVIQARGLGRRASWTPKGKTELWIALSGEVSDKVVAGVVATLASYNSATEDPSLEGVLRTLNSRECIVAPGGLRARAAGFEILPSCCCGLEGWREWYDVRPSGQSPWLGHDPNAWVDCGPKSAILWADEFGRDAPSLIVAYPEIKAALALANVAMTAFTERLSLWLAKYAPTQADFAETFAKAFDVHPPPPKTGYRNP